MCCQPPYHKTYLRDGGQVVSVLAFISDEPSSNPTEFFCKVVFEKNENKKTGRGWPIFFKIKSYLRLYGQLPNSCNKLTN